MPEPAQSTSSCIRIVEELMHKNRLQEYTQRASLPLPVYQTINEGVPHAPKFRSTVLVDGAVYTSPHMFANRKAAEQDVAGLALASILQKAKDERCPLIEEDASFCKSILNEFATKTNQERPAYNTIQSEGLLPVFVSSVAFNGATYTGKYGKNKKEAEQFAARAAIISLLGAESAKILLETIKSKAKLFDALRKVKSSSNTSDLITGNEKKIEENSILRASSGEGANPFVTNPEPSSNGLEVGASGHASLGEDSNPQGVLGMVELKSPKTEQPLEGMVPNFSMLAPSDHGQSLDVGPGSGKKRRKNKKKSSKKPRVGSELPVNATPQNQVASCSDAQ